MMFMMLIMVLFWSIVIAGIVFAIRGLSGTLTGPGMHPESRETALEILRNRYARGEIDTAEYEDKKRQLTS